MTLKETLSTFSTPVDSVNIRIYDDDYIITDVLWFTDEWSRMAKTIIGYVDRKTLDLEVTSVEVEKDEDGEDMMLIDIDGELVGRNVYLDEETFQDAIDLVYEKLSEINEGESDDEKNCRLDRLFSLRDTLLRGELVYA